MSLISLDVNKTWPQKNARLFVGDGAPEQFSRIGWGDASHQFSLYIQGYKTGGDVLLQHAIASKSPEQLDILIFPILFMYRQFIELELKWIFLVFSDSDRSEKRTFINDSSHDLIKLWKKAKNILLENATPIERNDVSIVEDYIKQFHEIDKSSFSFRYPITKDLDQILNTQHRINLSNLLQRMNELYQFFRGANGKLSSLRDYRHDMENYFGL
jgi:hypothetical protein